MARRFEGECSGALAELNKLRHGLQSMLAIEVGMQTKLGMVTREKHFMDVYFGIQPEVKEIRASD